MGCPACGQENREGAAFCDGCGGALTTTCPSCTSNLRINAQFCDSCGAAVGAATPEPRSFTPPQHLADKILHSRGAIEGERKQVTVLFADVRGSMALQEQVDAEAWRTIMDGFFHVLADGVHRYEGTVTQFTGDGIMALFGAPIAHEDHAQRACYAALQLQNDVKRYASEVRKQQGLDFAVRLGLNSGEVVVAAIGDDLHMDYTAIGHTVGLAQRMETMADPGTVFLTEHTASIVGGFFAMRDLGPMTVKGVQGELGVRELQGVGAARSRLDVARAGGFSKFVGRDGEMRTLHDALERARSGDGQVVGVVALAGTGKSRLCYEFTQQCSAQHIPVYEAHGVAHGKAVPLLPMLEFMRRFFRVTEQDTDQQARQKVAGMLLLLDKAFDDVLPVLFEFLGIPDAQRPVPQGMAPEAKQRQLFGMVQQLMRQATAPAVLLFEDLHWFDAASLGFVEAFVEAVPGAHALLLVSFRPEFEAEWTRQSTYQQIALAPLDAEATTYMLDDLLGQDPSLNGVPQLIRDGTGGNPFFIEEAVQDLAEHGGLAGAKGAYTLTRPIEELTIPATVQAVLSARIDRLPEGQKDILQTAAVIGRTFSEPVLRRVLADAPVDLEAVLHALVGAQFLYATGQYPQAEYIFKHALTQEVAYHSQLTDRRTRTHTAVAQAIEALYSDDLDERAAVLAHHHEAAGDHLPAAQWHRRAARWIGSSDIPAALHHWQQVGVLVAALPESEESDRLAAEACFQMLNWGWRAGMSAEEATGFFERGKELATRLNDMRGLWLLHGIYGAIRGYTEGDVRANVEFAEEAARIAEARGLDSWMDAVSLFAIGRLDDALAAAQHSMELTREDPDFDLEIVGFRIHVLARVQAGYFLALTGRASDGERLCRQALDAGRQMGETETLGWGAGYLCGVEALQGATAAAQAHGQEGLHIAETIGSSHSRVLARGWLAYGFSAAQDWENLTAVLGEAIQISRRDRVVRHFEAEYLALLAQGYLGRGELKRARATADEAVAMAVDRGVKFQECQAQYALARVLLGTEGADAREQIQAALDRGLELVQETGGAIMEPFLRVELAELARLTGDADTRERELCEAQRLFTDMGAPIRAQHVAELLEKI